VTARLQIILCSSDFCSVKKSQGKKIRKKFGQRVRHLRKQQNISQAQLAFESGLSREQISRIERGIKNVSLETIVSLSIGFDIPLKDLCDFEIGEK